MFLNKYFMHHMKIKLSFLSIIMAYSAFAMDCDEEVPSRQRSYVQDVLSALEDAKKNNQPYCNDQSHLNLGIRIFGQNWHNYTE